MRPKFSQPRDQLWNEAKGFDNVVVIGQKNGESQVLSTLDKSQTEGILEGARTTELTG